MEIVLNQEINNKNELFLVRTSINSFSEPFPLLLIEIPDSYRKSEPFCWQDFV